MESTITGRCLCGAVRFQADSEPIFQSNCHCDDCRRSAGSVYASFVFVPTDTLTVTAGHTASYQHVSDRGNVMTKSFCPTCGSQLFTANDSRPERRGIRVGALDDASWFRPTVNVYHSRKLPSTPDDPDLAAFDEMPQ